METADSCEICGSIAVNELFTWQDVPANIGILWPNREDALGCKKGDLRIYFCEKCGYVWNAGFEPDRLEYSQAYDNNLHHSATYAQYAKNTAQHLINRYQLHGKKVIEIGCGKGDFLILLCTMGDNQGLGFDTSFEERDLDSKAAERISIIRDFYSEKYADHTGDLVASRYVLEHIENPVQFLNSIRRSIGDREETIVYFEVPDVYLILEQLSAWDFIYEHVSYFSPGSLATLFEMCGFKILDLYETFGGQFIGIEAAPVSGSAIGTFEIGDDVDRIGKCVKHFQPQIDKKLQEFSKLIQRIRKENQRVLVWGAGAKGVSYLNMLNIRDEIKYIVDINPNKHGNFVAGTGQKIVPPEFAKSYNPDLVIVMNPIYESEIQLKLKEMNVTTETINV